MALVRMALGNYRCFARRQDIELRPITVVLGRNNSGKSALVRAPVLIDTGIHTNEPTPFDLDRLGEGLVGRFVDLIHGRRAHGGIEIDLTVEHGQHSHRVRATVQNVSRDRYDTQVVSELELPESHIRLEWELNDPAEAPRYSVAVGNEVKEDLSIPFFGLLPAASPFTLNPPLSRNATLRLLHQVSSFRNNFPAVRYFGPFREQPQRRYLLPARMPKELGTTGLHAARILASDTAGRQGELIRRVNQAIADLLPGWTLDLVDGGEVWSLVLRSATGEDFTVNLADAGTGVAQTLPIFVQRALDLVDPPRRPVLEIIEQPELHLHPAAHAGLADLYLAAWQATGVRFLIETHSETFLLRLRRRVAEGLDPDTVAIYFVEHDNGSAEARRIHIDADGNLDYWPTGVFSEDYEETRALARAQWTRRDPRAR
jgi:hypothetical protein